jgi:hypothetical protein
MIVTFPSWFPREYLALVGLFLWTAMIGGPILFADWLHNRRQRRVLTAAPESRPKSSE